MLGKWYIEKDLATKEMLIGDAKLVVAFKNDKKVSFLIPQR